MNRYSAFHVPKTLFLQTRTRTRRRPRMQKVFVYGTLKRQEPNNHWLQDPGNGKSKYLIDGLTKTKYPLIIATKYNIPFLLYNPGKGEFVRGEVYEVDVKMLGNLDILEDHPNYYVRERDDILIKNPVTKETESLKCWVYFLKNFKPELLKRPYMENYSTRGSHGLPYMDRSKRDPLYNPSLDIKPEKDTMK